MVDLIEEVILPSKGLVYKKEIAWKNRLRAPRLCDKGIGDLTRKNKLQANILDKTLLEPLGISAYDLHTADFLYLNFRQRQIIKGDTDYKVSITCPHCKQAQSIAVNLSEIKVNYLSEKPDYTFKTLSEETIEYSYLTPRIFDEASIAAEQFKEEFPDTDQDVYLQELLRKIIQSVDGRTLTFSQMTSYLNELYISDVNNLLDLVTKIEFGLDLNQTATCSNCHKKIKYVLPV